MAPVPVIEREPASANGAPPQPGAAPSLLCASRKGEDTPRGKRHYARSLGRARPPDGPRLADARRNTRPEVGRCPKQRHYLNDGYNNEGVAPGCYRAGRGPVAKEPVGKDIANPLLRITSPTASNENIEDVPKSDVGAPVDGVGVGYR